VDVERATVRVLAEYR